MIIIDPTSGIFSSFHIWIRSLGEMKDVCLVYLLQIMFKSWHICSLFSNMNNIENLKLRASLIIFIQRFTLWYSGILDNLTKTSAFQQYRKDPESRSSLCSFSGDWLKRKRRQHGAPFMILEQTIQIMFKITMHYRRLQGRVSNQNIDEI